MFSPVVNIVLLLLKCPKKMKGLRQLYLLKQFLELVKLKCPKKMKGLRRSFVPATESDSFVEMP